MRTMSCRFTVLALGALLAGCESGPDSPALARAAGHRLTVDEAVTLLAGATDVPNDRGVVEALAELWVDYTLLAEAMAEDSTLSHLDMGPLVRQQAEVQAILALRDSTVRPDTAISAEELEELYETEGAGVRARARHILLAFPRSSPSQEEIDSLQSLARELRGRVMAGESFAALAREYSKDPGSAAQGGDLGWFERGQMVRSFDEAVFALEPGEISEVVRSPYGYHVILLDEKEVPSFDEARDRFRTEMQQRRIAEAESVFVAGVVERADMRVTEEGAELTRQMARNPRTRLSGRAGGRRVAEYEGGEVTLAEVRDFMLTRPPQYRSQVAAADDGIVRDAVIQDLVRRELLLERSAEEGYRLTDAEVDSLDRMARERFAEAARELGLASIQAQPGESRSQAVERRVETLLRETIRGERPVPPTQAIGYVLRREYPSEIFGDAVAQRVMDRVAAARGSGSPQGAASPLDPGSAPPRGGAQGQPGAAPPPPDTSSDPSPDPSEG